ncbi:RNA polymerase sigma factor [Streptomyces sp. NRRL F-5123]|uniref:RNA polymerase sigma factor n=1 Tax=Streptomyces sp. NRRL F-5123 TaxID=1463856 RepID=UPI000A484593|nr:RNA polymerase sigma factor [Streptomyces sp. NRRL F-5123]
MPSSERVPRSRGGPAAGVLDKESFAELYRRHVDAITRFMARRVDDPHTVADLTADVFVAAIDSAHTFKLSAGSEVGWLYGIARHVVVDELRRAGREARKAGRIAGRRLLDEDDIGRLEEKLDAESAGRRLRAAMAGLQEGERAAMELVVVDQLTVREAAQALGIRQVSVRVRLHRARKTLRASTNTSTDDNRASLAIVQHTRGML